MSVPPEPAPPSRRYDVIVPVKRLDHAKTRLAEVGDEMRRDLVLAFLLDTVDAVAGSVLVSRIVVVSDDPVVAREVGAAFEGRAVVVSDPSPTGLNHALHRGVSALGARDEGVLGLCADLPALTSPAVTQLLRVAPRTGSGFVADRAGTGTTAYLAANRSQFAPQFGHGSRAAHQARGAADLTSQVSPLLRCDVDTRADLTALRDVLAPRTRDVVSRNENSPLLD
jgi:2-phospho-L-lactate/phosphoenolpyruvate guanylyltransferase